MKITTDYLLSLEACKSGIDAFSNLFPGGEAELNSENLSKARCGGLDIIWLIERIADQATLATLSKDDDYLVRDGVSLNQSTPPATLAKLSKDDSGWVRAAVARNRNTPPATLTTLSKDDDYLVRRVVARNRNTPPATLTTLSKDDDYLVRVHVARNPAYTGSRGSALIATNEELVR